MKHITSALVLSLITVLGATMGCSKESAASGPSGTRLALSAPTDQRMVQGDSNKIAISVDRTGFGDAVTITFANLPEGVSVEGDSIPAGDTKKDFVLVATPTAKIVEKQIVTVTAKGSSITTSQTFKLTVTAKI